MEGETGPPSPAGELGPALVVALLVVSGALWIVGSVDLQLANADVLVPVFTSLYHWTPFFWGETRFGMAIPLLASPIQDPVANLVTQKAIGHAMGLLLPFLLARWLGGRQRWILAGTLGAITLIFALGAHWMTFYFVGQCYVPSATAAVAGMILLDAHRHWRRIAGGVLLAVAFWITPSTLLWLTPMMVWRACVPPPEVRSGVSADRRFSWIPRLAGVAGLALALAWSGRLVPGVVATPLGLSPAAQWPSTWGMLVRGTAAQLPRAWLVLLAGSGLLLAGHRFFLRESEGRRRALQLALALAVGAWAQILGAGLFSWVAKEGTATYGWRFAVPSVVFVLLVPPFAVAALLPSLDGKRARLGRSLLRPGLVALALTLVVAILRLEPPSLLPVRENLEVDRRYGLHLDPFARELVERRATHFLAPYWLAYPIAFHANSVLYLEGGSRMVWPLAQRSEVARIRWEPADWSTARIAVLRRMPETSGSARPPTFDLETDRASLGLPELERVESGDLVDIYRGSAVAHPPG